MGRLLASPRLGTRSETLGRTAVSLGPDALAAIDHADRKSKIFFKVETYLVFFE